MITFPFRVQHLGHFEQSNPAKSFPLMIWWALWIFVSPFLFSDFVPSSIRVLVLRVFGAKIGRRCVIKAGVKIKQPWLLRIGSFVWIGEKVWIDNISPVVIGSSSCISQGVYVCTGNHDYRDRCFPYRNKPVVIKSQVWIGAFSVVAPGTIVDRCSVVAIGSTVSGHLKANSIFSNPSIRPLRPR